MPEPSAQHGAPPPESPSSTARAPGQPYCGVCGYQLSGVTESSKCPECGTALVECLMRGPIGFRAGKARRYTSPVQALGLPILQIALGPDPATGEMRGKARALIAIGDSATGAIAIGGVCKGGVCAGGVCIGLFTMGGVSIGALTAAGGVTIGAGLSAGGVAVGSFAVGGVAAGYGVVGGVAVGRYAYGGVATGQHVVSGGGGLKSNPQAALFFQQNAWFFGTNPAVVGQMSIAGWQSAVCVMAIDLVAALGVGLVALWARWRRGAGGGAA